MKLIAKSFDKMTLVMIMNGVIDPLTSQEMYEYAISNGYHPINELPLKGERRAPNRQESTELVLIDWNADQNSDPIICQVA